MVLSFLLLESSLIGCYLFVTFHYTLYSKLLFATINSYKFLLCLCYNKYTIAGKQRYMQRWYKNRGGFALPTVLIASMVMLSILTVSVTSVATVRNNLKTQYYSQLAKVAGEAGTAYAQACLAKNGNVPQWSDASPLRPNTDCTGTPLSTLTCPGSAGCYVLSTATYRSSFSVAMPTLDAQGKAMTIPNKGFVELLRASTGEVWRTYYQPAAQPAVVPDLCSGEATSALGWSNAVISSAENQISISGATAAAAISTASGLIPAGPMYFQRNFNVSSSGTYTVRVQTKSSKDAAEIYMDGTKLTTSNGALASTTATLSVGCHTISVRLTNKSVAASYSQFAAAVTKSGATAPVVVTDTAWRASAGASTSFSSPDYYADPSVWQTVTAYSIKTHGKQYANWTTANAPDKFAAMISPSGNGCPGSCPGGSYAYLRDSSDFYLSTATSVTVSTVCDDKCAAYIDGVLIHTNSSSSSTVLKTPVSLAAGYHHFGIILFNGSTATNPAGVAGTVVAGTTVYSRTDRAWQGSTTWTAGSSASDVLSYAASFSPNPDNFVDTPTVDLLVVGGGGGGGTNAAGGGGAGGVQYFKDIELSSGTYTVTVGAGGVKGSSGSVAGTKGGQSQFGTYISAGGGGGASRDGGTAATSGGSGGAGAGATTSTPLRTSGAAGTSGQGNAGGNGVTADGSVNATGGGGGGVGNAGFAGASGALAGDGGAGAIFYLGTTRYAVGGGGGGGVTVNGTKGDATDGGGNGGAKGAAAAAATANTGGGGGGGGTAGGNGGTGLVVVCFETGSMTVSATGTYSTSTATINGIGYTFYKFTASGTFTISTLKAS